ncbi:MAG: PAS domain S-box protein [Geopsychrobacter sp.]|nr:PAS domain S-box protein [Geopsychrobacter sp.]
MSKSDSLHNAQQRIAELEAELVRLRQQEEMRQREIEERNRLQREHQVITQRLLDKRARLNESMQTLDAVIESLPSPIFYKNIEGVYTGCNQAFCAYLGKTREQIIGHTFYDIAPTHLANDYHRADLQLMTHHGTQIYQSQVRNAAGCDRDIIFNKATIGAPDAEVLGLVGIMTDITDIRHAEHEVSSLQNLLRNIIDSMPSALITIDSQYRVSHWNQQAEKISGLSAEKAIGRTISETLPLLTSDMGPIERALISRCPCKISKSLPDLQGEMQFWEVVIYPLMADEMAGAVVRIDNVSDRVRMEEVMVQSEKMMSLGGLAAGMAHEINNPLAGILQGAQLVRSRLLGDSPKNRKLADELGLDLEKMHQFMQRRKITKMLEMISDAGERAAKTVHDMLSFGREEAPELLPCDLKSLIAQTLKLANQDLTGGYDLRRLHIVNQLPDDLPLVLGVKSQLQQVVLNMLRNAAQAIFNWCELNAEPVIRISATIGVADVTIHMADNGPGIAEEFSKRIFEPFFTTKNANKGTGLGLSVSYYIITDTHKGALTVNSTPGDGACFNISLPISAASPISNI